jgi:hypothetical protein
MSADSLIFALAASILFRQVEPKSRVIQAML